MPPISNRQQPRQVYTGPSDTLAGIAQNYGIKDTSKFLSDVQKANPKLKIASATTVIAPHTPLIIPGQYDEFVDAKPAPKVALQAPNSPASADSTPSYSGSGTGNPSLLSIPRYDQDGNIVGWTRMDGSSVGGGGGGGGSGGVSPSSFAVSPTNLKGNSNVQKAYNYFIQKGLSPAQAAGIVGNLMQESGANVDPGSVQSGGPGRGIAQWSVGQRWTGVEALARSQGKSPTDLGVQLDYLWQELNTTERGSLTALKQTSDPGAAALAFEQNFERANAAAANNPGREANARAIVAQLGNA